MAATLSGTVGLTGFGRINLVIRFFTPTTDTEIMKAASVPNAGGVFIVTGITPGTYDVGVKCDNSKSLLVGPSVFTDGLTTNINFGNLLRGDLNQDDCVTAADFSILSVQIGTCGACLGYAGDWLLPCDIPADDCGGGGVAAKGAAYKIIGGQPTVI